jgi:hypothetical protein
MYSSIALPLATIGQAEAPALFSLRDYPTLGARPEIVSAAVGGPDVKQASIVESQRCIFGCF